MAAKYEDGSIGGMPGVLARGRDARTAAPAADQGVAMADTLPPQPLKELLSAGGANLFVLSVDDELVDTVQRAGGEQYPVFPVAKWDALEAAVVSGRCGIALLDADLVGAKLVDYISALEAYAGRVVTLVAADRAAAQELMGYLSDRRIHRLLIKPASLGITRLLVESAVNRCLQLREQAATSDGLDAHDLNRVAAPSRRWSRFTGVVAVFVVGAALAVWLLGGHAPDRAASTPDVAGTTTAAPDQSRSVGESGARFADLLSRASQAFDAGRVAAPTGDNALDYYLTVLSMEPEQPVARARIAAIVESLFAQAESALLSSSLDSAAAALAGVRRADPASSRLAFLEAQLERARTQATAPAAKASPAREAPAPVSAAPAPAAPPTELDSLLVIASARMARGQLLDPTGDSAFEYVRRAAEINRSDSRVVRIRAALALALLDAARAALAGDAVSDVSRFLATAKDLGAPAEAVTAVERDLAGTRDALATRRHGEWLAAAAERVRAGALTEPGGDSALDYLHRLQDEAPGFAGLGEAWDSWTAALAARTRQLIATRNWAGAEAALAALDRAPRGAAAAAPLRQQLETDRLQAQYLATASPAGELELLTAPPLIYPADARRLNIQGWVDLDFVVDRSGQPQNLNVVAAEPAGRFDQAALSAVAKYRYKPFERGGQVYERRVRLRVRFALN